MIGTCEKCGREDEPLFMCDVDGCDDCRLLCEECGDVHLARHAMEGAG